MMKAAARIDVDVVILSWNRPDDTLAAIASAAAQEGVRQRLLIVDQGSAPENLRRLEDYLAGIPDARLRKLGRNAGVAGGRNLAAAMGDAPYIVALDSDAVFKDRQALEERLLIRIQQVVAPVQGGPQGLLSGW